MRERRETGHNSRAIIEGDAVLSEVLGAIASGAFSPDEPGRYHGLVDVLYNSDYFMVTADFAAYYDAQRQVDRAFADKADWTRRAALNTARMGWFSSDRAVRGYASDIWDVPVPDGGAGDAERAVGKASPQE